MFDLIQFVICIVYIFNNKCCNELLFYFMDFIFEYVLNFEKFENENKLKFVMLIIIYKLIFL